MFAFLKKVFSFLGNGVLTLAVAGLIYTLFSVALSILKYVTLLGGPDAVLEHYFLSQSILITSVVFSLWGTTITVQWFDSNWNGSHWNGVLKNEGEKNKDEKTQDIDISDIRTEE